MLVCLDVGAGVLSACLPGAGEAFFGFMRHRSAVLACAFAVFGGSGASLPASVVPFCFVEGVFGFGVVALMLEVV